MKVFFVLIILLIINNNSYSFYLGNNKVSCEGDISTQNVCASYIENKKSYQIKKRKCKEGEKCINIGTSENKNMYQCVKILKKKRFGEKCGNNADCLSNICKNKKCSSKKENESCSNEYLQCSHYLSCIKGKCTKISKENEFCDNEGIYCDYGLECNTNINKCQKIGTLKIGEICGDNEILCETGISYKNRCISVKVNGHCEENNDNEKFCVGLEFDEGEGEGEGKEEKCVEFAGEDLVQNYECHTSKAKELMFRKYIKKFRKIDFGKFKRDEKSSVTEGNFRYDFGKFDLVWYYQLYKNMDKFIARGFFSDEGNKNKKYDCEIEWMIRMLDSYNLKFSYLLFYSLILFLL